MSDIRLLAFMAVVVGAIALAACGGGEGNSTPTATSAATTTAAATLATTPTPEESQEPEVAGDLLGPGLWELKPQSPSSALQALIDSQCQDGGDEAVTATETLEALGQGQFNIWEYWKAARLHNLANAQMYEACGALSPPANPGFILPLPPTTLIEQIQTNSFKSESCDTLAQQMAGLYVAITKDVQKAHVYFEIQPNLQPLEERWLDECSS